MAVQTVATADVEEASISAATITTGRCCTSSISATSLPSMVEMVAVISVMEPMARIFISMCLAVPWYIMPKQASLYAMWLMTGNFQFRTSTNQAPRYAQPGEPMQEMTIIMELKLLADVGLVGFPNAGKSTLLSAVSSARPKIANYPFTTLEPSLGIVDYRDHQSFVMADIPGIIEGASEGKGLGLRFLRHIERNSLLLFMVPGDTDDIKKEYEVLLGELKNFNPEMLDKHRVLAITKCDLLDEELIEMLKETLPTDLPVVFISSVTGQGIQELKDVLWKELNSESNKLQEITAEDTLVHRDKDMSRFQQELAAEGEDVVEYIDEDEIEDVDDLDDFEYE